MKAVTLSLLTFGLGIIVFQSLVPKPRHAGQAMVHEEVHFSQAAPRPALKELSVRDLEALRASDLRLLAYRELTFPMGKLVDQKQLDDDTVAETFMGADGDTTTRVLIGGRLVGEKWSNKEGQSIVRSYRAGHIFAIAEERGDSQSTIFLSDAQEITKRLDRGPEGRVCISYGEGRPIGLQERGCQNEMFSLDL